MKQGTVALVGAGPGDPGLMTKRGWQCIQEADVIVYDALACPSVLNGARPDCQLIFAGKQAGHHFKKQKETNLLLAQLAAEGKRVVRLKGGDPFIFGRGGEEGQVLREHGIPFEVVPGVSSCYGVPAYAGIPVTHRSYASSFHVITGHKQLDHQLNLDYNNLAELDGTLVILMSLMNLPHIAEELIHHGKSADTPAAVIQAGTTARQRTVTATLGTIAEAVRQQQIQTPAMTIIGDVVQLREELQWFEQGPLFGKHIVITGTPTYNQRLAEALRQLGAQVTELSLIQTEPLDAAQLQQVDWQAYGWLVFTSVNGVELFFQQLVSCGIDLRRISPCRFAAIGKGTAAALAEHGIFVDCMPAQYDSAHLAKAMIPAVSETERVLLLRAENGTVLLPELLQQAGISVDTVALYRTAPDHRKQELLPMALQDADYLVFSSASAVQAYGEMAGELGTAFTSGMIRRKLAQRGVEIDDVAGALQRLVQDGYTHVYCQPTHLIPGDEYEKLCRDAAPYGDCFETLQIGTPLLTAPVDYPALLAAMTPMVEHSTHTAYVFMGHGTTHSANAAYPAFDNYWRYHGYGNVFVGTVEGYPTLDTILALLQKGGYRRVVLSPMMLVAGDHAQNDMAGPAPDSWASVLTAQGYQVETRLQGLGEYAAIQARYVAHVKQMLERT